MKKQIFMALLAAVSSFAMISCGDDDKNNDPKPSNQTTETKASWKDTGSEIQINESIVTSYGTETTTTVYSYSGNTITNMVITVDYGSPIIAQQVYDATEPDEIENTILNGSKIIYTASEEEYKNLDTEFVRIMAQEHVDRINSGEINININDFGGDEGDI